MDDLVKRLRALAHREHDDLDIGFEAAAAIEARDAILRECVEAMRRAVNDLDGKKLTDGSWVDMRDIRTTLAKSEEMLK